MPFEKCPCCGEPTLYQSYGMAMVGPDFYGYHCDPCRLDVYGQNVGLQRRRVYDLIARKEPWVKEDLLAAVDEAKRDDRAQFPTAYE